jgi:tetratricopeptide (TPR) repeat protein
MGISYSSLVDQTWDGRIPLRNKSMNPLRSVGLLTVVFVLTLPFMYLLNHGLPALKFGSTIMEDDIPDEPDDPATDALLLKAVLYVQDGQNDKAVAAYTEAIQRSPKYSIAYIGRGDAYLAKSGL